ncbi:hypothetical protein CAPTEDRAFT_222642 [Capitella teleta]|uniref:D-serine dehydratase-like domain-containing protein n=1 Tax=Capitella teleta TaxID=283909 RepID=R7UMA9_CAPTE|nr:hypothetical protein CAPTEDRAFT_222642 [Capitella teleta]|eukprot:ELU04402.1 hypothetical protein CAPTEDRAFT_222642 [Capitella teleta]
MALLKKLNSFHVMLDNEAHLQVLEQHPLPDHQKWSAFLKVDTGGMRDVQQTIIGSCAQSEIAVRVATRVKGHCLNRNQLLIDAGFLAMSWDGFSAFDGALGGSFCRVDGHDNLKLVKMSQEVGHIEPRSGSLDFASHPIGSLLFLLPYHACATACQFTEFYGHSGDQITNHHNDVYLELPEFKYKWLYILFYNCVVIILAYEERILKMATKFEASDNLDHRTLSRPKQRISILENRQIWLIELSTSQIIRNNMKMQKLSARLFLKMLTESQEVIGPTSDSRTKD